MAVKLKQQEFSCKITETSLDNNTVGTPNSEFPTTSRLGVVALENDVFLLFSNVLRGIPSVKGSSFNQFDVVCPKATEFRKSNSIKAITLFSHQRSPILLPMESTRKGMRLSMCKYQ